MANEPDIVLIDRSKRGLVMFDVIIPRDGYFMNAEKYNKM